MLTISGEHRESTEQQDAQHVRRERRYGSFELRIPLPEEAKQTPVTITPTAKS